MQTNTTLSPKLASLSLCLTTVMGFGFTSCQSNPTQKQAKKVAQQPNDSPLTQAPPELPVAKPTPLPVHQGPHFDVFDFLRNRPLAHRLTTHEQGDIFSIDASTMDFVRYVHGNHPNQWKLPVELLGETVAMVRGKRATLHVPAWTPAKVDTIELRLHNPNKKRANAVNIKINNKKLPPIALKPGWQTIKGTIPAGLIGAENKIELSFTRIGKYKRLPSGGALRWLRLGPKTAIEDTQPKKQGALISLDRATQGHHELRLKPKQGLVWFTWLPKNSKLALTVHAPTTCGPWIKIRGQGGAARTKPLMNKQIVLVEDLGKTQTTTLDLSRLIQNDGEVVRVEILNNAAGCKDSISIAKAQILKEGARPTVPKIKPPKYIVFWKVDTLRADYLPFYGDPITKTPALSEVAKHGAVFKTAFVEGNESRVSHASMFSGMYPSKNGVHPMGKLNKKFTLLTEAMQAAGYQTIGRASNGYVSKTYGYEQGWDEFNNDLKSDLAYNGKSIVKRVNRMVDKYHKKPFFLYVGTVDPHATYRAHKGILKMYDNEPYSGQFRRTISGKNLGAINRRVIKVNARDKTRIRALYRNEITFNDQAFAMMRDHFKKLGIWEDTMFILTADHGDGFWEHRKVGHGHNLHQELVHVPMVIHYPKMMKKGRVIEAGADVLDLFPTIQAIIGAKRHKTLQGKNLLENIFKVRGDYPEAAIATFELRRYTMQLGPWKMIMKRNHTRLYDRRVDKLELRNIGRNNPLAHRWVIDALSYFRYYRKGWDKSTWGEPNNLTDQFIPRSQGQVEKILTARNEDDDDINGLALVPK